MILAIDTSASVAVAVVNDASKGGEADAFTTVSARTEFAPRGHAELLAVFVKEALAEAGVSRPDRVVVGTGPAPFTGLRVGIVTARMLAFAWDVPCDGVCSLDAVAVTIAGEATVVADARRKEVYWATYRDGLRLTEPQVGAAGSVEPVGTVLGRGAALYPEIFPGARTVDPDPARLVAVAAAARRAGATDLSTEPLYLRRPDVHGVPA